MKEFPEAIPCLKTLLQPGVVAHTCNPGSQEANGSQEAGEENYNFKVTQGVLPPGCVCQIHRVLRETLPQKQSV